MSHSVPAVAFILAISFLAVTAAACGGGPGTSNSNRSSLPGVELAEGGAVRISEATLEVIGPRLSDYERAALDDRLLSLPEYEAAYLESIRCVELLGYTVTDKQPPTLLDGASFGAFRQGPPSLELDESFKACKTAYLANLTGIWTTVHGPSANDLQRARDAIGECLRTMGVEIADHPSSDELIAYVRGAPSVAPFGQCKAQVESQVGFRLR